MRIQSDEWYCDCGETNTLYCEVEDYGSLLCKKCKNRYIIRIRKVNKNG